MSEDKNDLSRRDLLQMAAGLGVAGAAVAAPALGAAQPKAKAKAPAAPKVKFNNTFNFMDPEWNRDAYARLQGDLDFTKTRFGWLGGPVMGVVPGEKVKPLFYMEGFSSCRFIPVEGGYRKLLREVVVYREMSMKGPGKILETWDNPYTGETVRVVPIMNDPVQLQHHTVLSGSAKLWWPQSGKAAKDSADPAVERQGQYAAPDNRYPSLLSERAAA